MFLGFQLSARAAQGEGFSSCLWGIKKGAIKSGKIQYYIKYYFLLAEMLNYFLIILPSWLSQVEVLTMEKKEPSLRDRSNPSNIPETFYNSCTFFQLCMKNLVMVPHTFS